MLTYNYRHRESHIKIAFIGHEDGNPDKNDMNLQKQFLKQVYPFESIYFLNQVHGNTFLETDSFQPSGDLTWGDGDAVLISKNAHPAIIRTADCIPILFSINHVVGGIHAGWRGLDQKIIPKVLMHVLKNNSANLNEICFHIGPHIRADSYEVGADVFEKFSQNYYKKISKDKALLNLTEIAIDQILSTGISANKINLIHDNTFNSDQWYSHRKGDQGRNLALIWRNA